jgi:hypothetical protein
VTNDVICRCSLCLALLHLAESAERNLHAANVRNDGASDLSLPVALPFGHLDDSEDLIPVGDRVD